MAPLQQDTPQSALQHCLVNSFINFIINAQKSDFLQVIIKYKIKAKQMCGKFLAMVL